MRPRGAREQALIQAGFRVSLIEVGKRVDVRGVEEVHVRLAVARRLGEAVIETAASGPGDMRPYAVKDAPVLLVLVEAVIEKRAQKTTALRSPKPDRPLDVAPLVANERGPASGSAVLEKGNEVADAGGPESHQDRVLRFVDNLVDLTGLESRANEDVCPVGHRGSILLAGESPLTL